MEAVNQCPTADGKDRQEKNVVPLGGVVPAEPRRMGSIARAEYDYARKDVPEQSIEMVKR
jgi:hypothetical protein